MGCHMKEGGTRVSRVDEWQTDGTDGNKTVHSSAEWVLTPMSSDGMGRKLTERCV